MPTFGDITQGPRDPEPFTVQGMLLDPIPAVPEVTGPKGKVLQEGKPEVVAWSETFHVLPDPPAGALDSFVKGMRVDGQGRQVYDRVSMCGFIRDCLVPADEARWDALMGDKNRLLRIEVVAEVAGWIAGTVTNRPSGT